MTKEEVKEILDHNWTKLVNPDYSDDDLAEAQNWVIETLSAELQGFEEYLKQYLGENDQMIIGNDVWEETKAKAEQTEWISVKEHGKPKKSGKYWVTIQSTTSSVKWVRADEYHAERDFFDTEMEWSNSGIKITAWQPITEPSPYKGE